MIEKENTMEKNRCNVFKVNIWHKKQYDLFAN